MSVLDTFARAPLGPVLFGWVVFALLLQILTVTWFLRAARRAGTLAAELAALAQEGEVQLARIRAREASTALEPLLAVLSGEPRPLLHARARPLLVPLAAVGLPAALTLTASLILDLSAAHLPLALSNALLVPSALGAGRMVFLAHRGSARSVRRACSELLEENARTEVERNRSAALRRRREGAPDP